ncbi:hypothetical protein KDAU_67010 [Dictyobacter aurantiacus]|uniref:Uncharacterized protein n=2 Tax=Dictyobacter aurantiacus TaxID=1936993 RepID=A0A401ZRC6_9CHLR|nr:hypothetical protein KDAU_67010 [Dictyobacter aurantiacus]
MVAAMHALHRGKQPQQRPSILDTFHNGCRDAPDTVEDEAMQYVLYWMSDFLEYFEANFNGMYRTYNTIGGQGE